MQAAERKVGDLTEHFQMEFTKAAGIPLMKNCSISSPGTKLSCIAEESGHFGALLRYLIVFEIANIGKFISDAGCASSI